MTTVYSVSHAEGTFYVPTKAEALALARDAIKGGDLYVNVTKNQVTNRIGKRDLYCALLNGESWCDRSEDVEL